MGLPLGLRRWMRLFKHVALQQCLVLGATIGAVGPDISGGVGGVDHPPQLPTVAVCGRGHRCLADKAEAPIDTDMRLVAEHRRCDLRQRCPVGAIADLAADLEGPARIDSYWSALFGLPRQISCLAQLLFERLHQCLERAALGQSVAIVADGVLVGHRAAKIETEEAHP